MTLRAGAWVLLACAGACTRNVAPAVTRDLDGVSLPLKSSPALRLSVDGAVGAIPAEVVFDVASIFSRVSSTCFDSTPSQGDTVRVPRPDGQTDVLPEVDVDELTFGNVHYKHFVAGYAKSEHCVVVLGNDQLLPWALAVDIAHRTLSFSHSQDRAYWSARAVLPPDNRKGFESHLLELTRDPKTDWPLLAVRLQQQGAEVVGPFVLSTGEGQSEIAADAVRGAGLVAGFELLHGVQLPPGIEVPSELASFKGITFDALELAPGVGIHEGALRAMPELEGKAPPSLGVLGCDVGGRFDAIIDVQAGVLLLQRPRVLASGAHERCERGGALDEESCFELEVEKRPGGIVATGTIWRSLPEGGRLHLELLGDKGPIASSCRLGFTFSATDRGDSTQHSLPWERLKQTMPACAQALASATRVEMSMSLKTVSCLSVRARAPSLRTCAAAASAASATRRSPASRASRSVSFFACTSSCSKARSCCLTPRWSPKTRRSGYSQRPHTLAQPSRDEHSVDTHWLPNLQGWPSGSSVRQSEVWLSQYRPAAHENTQGAFRPGSARQDPAIDGPPSGFWSMPPSQLCDRHELLSAHVPPVALRGWHVGEARVVSHHRSPSHVPVEHAALGPPSAVQSIVVWSQ